MATKINEEEPDSPEITDQGKPRGRDSDPDYREIESEFTRAQEVGRNQARLDRINQIARNADRVRASRDNGAEPEMSLEDMESTDEDESEASETTEEPLAEEAAEEQEETEQPAPTAKKFRIRVDGTDIELSEQELIARASKVSAADKYLEDAKRAKEESMRAAPSQDVRPPPPSPDEEDSALVRAIQVGTEDEAKAAVRKLRQQLSVNPDVVARTIDERINFKEAADTFRSEYKDLFENKDLLEYVLYKDSQLVRNGDKRPYIERYREIGDSVRKLMGPNKSAANRQEKIDRKASSANPPRAAAARATPPEVEDREETPSEIISNMAKARGQFVRG